MWTCCISVLCLAGETFTVTMGSAVYLWKAILCKRRPPWSFLHVETCLDLTMIEIFLGEGTVRWRSWQKCLHMGWTPWRVRCILHPTPVHFPLSVHSSHSIAFHCSQPHGLVPAQMGEGSCWWLPSNLQAPPVSLFPSSGTGVEMNAGQKKWMWHGRCECYSVWVGRNQWINVNFPFRVCTQKFGCDLAGSIRREPCAANSLWSLPNWDVIKLVFPSFPFQRTILSRGLLALECATVLISSFLSVLAASERDFWFLVLAVLLL